MRYSGIRAGLMAVAALVLVAPVALGAVMPHTNLTANLIRNGGAELGPSVATGSGVVASIPGWKRSGRFTVVAYGAPGGFPGLPIAAAVKGGAKFFAGGPENASPATGPLSKLTQDIAVATYAARIDAGSVTAVLSGALGGYSSQTDMLVISATFLGAAGNKLGVLRLPAVTAAQRHLVTTLLARSASAIVPRGTRTIRVSLVATRNAGGYNDGYADNLGLVLK
jgi:hypothetical protein